MHCHCRAHTGLSVPPHVGEHERWYALSESDQTFTAVLGLPLEPGMVGELYDGDMARCRVTEAFSDVQGEVSQAHK